MDAKELQKALEKAARERATADWHKQKATEKAADLMAQIKDTDGMTMGHAAEILGVSRVMAYKILNREKSA